MLRDKQHAIVGQGLALGCAHLGWTGGLSVLDMEDHFAAAWTGWPRRALFPGVFVGGADNNDWTNFIMVRSEYRPGRRAFWTDRLGSWAPQLDEGWTPQEIAKLLGSESQLPVTFDDWLDLGAVFISGVPRVDGGAGRRRLLRWANRSSRAAIPGWQG
ncbi:hypothetical protein [Catellatospora sp. NPDC049609]|uniref:hypothetical protein n=1 Tax=Catellatospora sp. NPDC049609 TaxID=3155505 RepID=UPI003420315C